MTNLKRLYLLSEAEIDELYAIPIFNQEERGIYFDLNKAELDALDQLTTTKTRLYFILQLGYFLKFPTKLGAMNTHYKYVLFVLMAKHNQYYAH